MNNTDNYRGIALIDILSKVYINIITRRLTFYTQAYNCICENQGGFREGYLTIDNAFVLHSIVKKYLRMKGKSIYAAFIIFKRLSIRLTDVSCMKYCIKNLLVVN